MPVVSVLAMELTCEVRGTTRYSSRVSHTGNLQPTTPLSSFILRTYRYNSRSAFLFLSTPSQRRLTPPPALLRVAHRSPSARLTLSRYRYEERAVLLENQLHITTRKPPPHAATSSTLPHHQYHQYHHHYHQRKPRLTSDTSADDRALAHDIVKIAAAPGREPTYSTTLATRRAVTEQQPQHIYHHAPSTPPPHAHIMHHRLLLTRLHWTLAQRRRRCRG